MGLYKAFETSKHLTETGAKCQFHEAANEDGTIPTFIVARSHNSNQLFTRAVAEIYTPEFNKRMAANALEEGELEAANTKVMIQGNIIGWENIQDRDGSPLPFTRENLTRVLSDLPELVDRIRAFSANMANYLKAAEDEAVKN